MGEPSIIIDRATGAVRLRELTDAERDTLWARALAAQMDLNERKAVSA